MPLSEGQISFKAELKKKLSYFFSKENDEENPYRINAYDENGELRSDEDIYNDREEKIAAFSEDISTLIYNFILTAVVNPGIIVQVNTVSGTGSTTSPGELS